MKNKIVRNGVVATVLLALLAIASFGITAASAHSTDAAKKKHHNILLVDKSTFASVTEDEGYSPTNQLTAQFEVTINGGLPNETYDVMSNMADRCDAVEILNLDKAVQEEGPPAGFDGDLGDVHTNFHGNAKFFVVGVNCIPNDNPNFQEGDYWVSITGDGGSHTSAGVPFEIVE